MFLSDTVSVDIVPAIIPQSRDDLVEKVTKVGAFAPEVQIDFVDGVFAKPASWPFSEGKIAADVFEGLDLGTIHIELDLMIQNPETSLDMFMPLKPTRVVIHIETITDFGAIVAHSKEHGYILGIAVQSTTPIAYIQALDASEIGYFQLMGISTIGSQGQPFDERVLDRIRELLGCCAEHPISIDGSVNRETLPLLYTAGANRFIVGSAIWKSSDPKTAYESLKTIVV